MLAKAVRRAGRTERAVEDEPVLGHFSARGDVSHDGTLGFTTITVLKLLLEGGLTGHWETPFGMGEPARRSPPQPIGEYSSKASRRPRRRVRRGRQSRSASAAGQASDWLSTLRRVASGRGR
ncbi:hypothetical protein [Salinispora arenicola]|uniref:hypothetical protein n=1 Tax=Salinispora arenicola TaxID=168697 RepID=UPI0027DAE1DA|nr:hypothetical protein [Salinispora arenicola]